MTIHEEISNYISNIIPDSKLQLLKNIPSSVTTAWGVQWDETQIARDIIQNFFDANRDNISSIEINIINQNDVIISAPNKFNLERLFYLGSEKGKDDIGQYGEGFKAAATCLLRDHDVNPIAISENQLVYLSLSSEKVKDTRLRPIIYSFCELSEAYSGTKLILPILSLI